MATGVEWKESEKVAGIALEFPANDNATSSPSSPHKLPRRLRRRLLESKSPSTVEEIEAKLKEADLRRQQFYEGLSNKARPKMRSHSWSPLQEADLGQRLETKLKAAEQKRLSILANAQMRLAKLDELRQAAKTGLEMRFVKERDELGMKVESRVQQAETNRMLLLKAYRQRRAAKEERAAQSLMRRMIQDSKYKECVRAAIHQKRAAAERKRLGLLEAEKTRAHARVLQVRKVVKFVYSQREIERRRMKDQLEDRLQRAKRQREEYLRQKGSLHSSVCANSKVINEQGELLARKLARCWRRFVRLRRTTFSLTKSYNDLEISLESVRSMPFEKLALQMESANTIQTVKALLDRFESRLMISHAATPTRSLSNLENIDNLLMRVTSPKRRGNTNNRGVNRVGSIREGAQRQVKLSRYLVRVVLCAYMILGHPDAVFSEKGEHEIALAESAATFVQEFELLIKIISDGPTHTTQGGTNSSAPNQLTFRSQLEAFDRSWCSYLYSFVAWKVKDAKLLEEDLVKAASQLEVSMMQNCKLTPEGDNGSLSHDMKAIQKQVTEDHKLLRTKVQNLSGNAGLEQMEFALSDAWSRFFEAKETGSSLVSSVAHISSPILPGSSNNSSILGEMGSISESMERSDHIVYPLFKKDDSSPGNEVVSSTPLSSDVDGYGAMSVTENELLVNEIVHEHGHGFADSFDVSDNDQSSIKEKVRETMEKAFWDGIMDSLKQDEPDYSWVLKLMKEVKDELCEMSPQSWRQEIVETIDIDILPQVLRAEILDIDFLGKILEFALVTLQKLSAPANDDKMKAAHYKLLKRLRDASQAGDKSNASFALLMVEGLRFVLDQIQTLRQEISTARIRMMEPLIKGPAGLEYLKKAFANRYGPPTDAHTSLPLTMQWLSSVHSSAEQEWDEYKDSVSSLTVNNERLYQGLPPTTLRTGGSIPMASRLGSPSSKGDEQPECKGERVDLLVRVGLLKLVNEIGGLMLETLPETLKLNLSRLRGVQSQFQKIIVIATSVLVLRQTLLSENMVTTPADMENIVSSCIKQLSKLLDTVEDVGISEIVGTISSFPEGNNHTLNPEKLQARKEVMANMLGKSLQAGDAIFTRVSHTVYLAARGIVLGGNGLKGRQLAEAALRRIGASLLTENVVEAAEVLIVVATVSSSVHGAWYEELVKNL